MSMNKLLFIDSFVRNMASCTQPKDNNFKHKFVNFLCHFSLSFTVRIKEGVSMCSGNRSTHMENENWWKIQLNSVLLNHYIPKQVCRLTWTDFTKKSKINSIRNRYTGVPNEVKSTYKWKICINFQLFSE